MPKPSAPTNVTQTTTNPVQVAQQPYLNYGWGQAQDLYKNNPQTYYPGQTLAPWMAPSPLQTQGYQDLYNTGQSVTAGMLPQANAAWMQAVGGQYGGEANPSNPYYQAYAEGTSPVTQNYQALQNQATNMGGQYAQQVGQYASPMQQQGANAANVGGQYAQQIGQYSDPMLQYGQLAGANNNLGLSQLGAAASGAYLNSNPYMAQMVQSAMDPVARNYQTSIAPSTDAMFSGGGRYGSGAMAGAVDTGQQNLAKGLSDLSGNLYGQQYARERQLQDAAAQQYGSLYNAGLGLGMQGVGNAANIQQSAGNMYLSAQDRAAAGLRDAANTQAAAGNQYWQGQGAAQQAANQYGAANLAGIAGLGSNFNTGNQAAMEALRMYPQLAQSAFQGPQATIQAGQGLSGLDQQYRQFQQAQIDDQTKRFYGEQQAPFNALTQYQNQIGQPTQGSRSETTPYYSNPLMGGLSALSGIAGAGKNFGLWGAPGAAASAAGGLGGLGGTAGIGGGFGSALSAAAPWATTGLATAAPIEAALLGGSAAAAPAAAAGIAAWIVCTELMRQGRMPKRWWLTGSQEFASYPEAVKRGYYTWAIPSVRHLRRKPKSLYSRFLNRVFNWRAEDIAARCGVKGARKLWRGRAVTAALWLPCLTLGALVSEQDWRQVYRPGAWVN